MDRKIKEASHELHISFCSLPVLASLKYQQLSVFHRCSSFVSEEAFVAQQSEDGNLHPVQYERHTMNATENIYFACEPKDLAAVFVSDKIRLIRLHRRLSSLKLLFRPICISLGK